jgi:hypothetical protein
MQNFGRDFTGRDHSTDLGVNWRIILTLLRDEFVWLIWIKEVPKNVTTVTSANQKIVKLRDTATPEK